MGRKDAALFWGRGFNDSVPSHSSCPICRTIHELFRVLKECVEAEEDFAMILGPLNSRGA